jgi:hypothetical protein
VTAASGGTDFGPLPLLAGPPNFHVGLKPIDPALWLFPDDQAAWLPEKRQLLDTRRAEVFAQDPHSFAAQSELLEAINAVCPNPFQGNRVSQICSPASGGAVSRSETEGVFADRVAPSVRFAATSPAKAGEDNAIMQGHGSPEQSDEPPLIRAARQVSDDLVILQRSDNAWQVVACCLCNPTFFSAPFALGKNLADLHAPVPDQGYGLASRIDRVFTHLQTGQVLERHNWTVQWSNARFTPDGAPLRHLAQSATVTGRGEHLFVRVERQTITRLPLCGAIVFTIRICLTSLRDIMADDGARAAFTHAWQDAPEHVRLYKRWAVLEPHVAALLANCNERRT